MKEDTPVENEPSRAGSLKKKIKNLFYGIVSVGMAGAIIGGAPAATYVANEWVRDRLEQQRPPTTDASDPEFPPAPTSIQTPETPFPKKDTPRTYVVQPGDTLSELAVQFNPNDPEGWIARVAILNDLPNLNQISAGSEIKLP